MNIDFNKIKEFKFYKNNIYYKDKYLVLGNHQLNFYLGIDLSNCAILVNSLGHLDKSFSSHFTLEISRNFISDQDVEESPLVLKGDLSFMVIKMTSHLDGIQIEEFLSSGYGEFNKLVKVLDKDQYLNLVNNLKLMELDELEL
jgi:hypothetical protein